MLPYWLMLSLMAAGTLLGQRDVADRHRANVPLVIAAIAIAVMVGLRYRVGADWFAYQRMFDYAGQVSAGEAIAIGDPGYMALNWFVQQLQVNIWLVNLIGGGAFAWGLYRLCRIQPEPWTAMLVAAPYLVIVVAMNYSRQAIALGFLMAGLADFSTRGSIKRFLFYVIPAGLFHKTAVMVIALAQLGNSRGRIVGTMLSFIAAALLFNFLLRSHVDKLLQDYVQAHYDSSGAVVRVAMDMVPAIAFLLVGKRMGFNPFESALWRNFSLASIVALAGLILVPSSAAVDRLAIYLLPLQVAVLARMPRLIQAPLVGRVLIVIYAAAVLYIWLNFADNSAAWKPYRMFFINV